MSIRSTTITLAGLKLPVRTSASEEELDRIMEIITAQLQKVRASAPTQPLHNHLALVALSLAQELIETRQEQQAYVEDVQGTAQDILNALAIDDDA